MKIPYRTGIGYLVGIGLIATQLGCFTNSRVAATPQDVSPALLETYSIRQDVERRMREHELDMSEMRELNEDLAHRNRLSWKTAAVRWGAMRDDRRDVRSLLEKLRDLRLGGEDPEPKLWGMHF